MSFPLFPDTSTEPSAAGARRGVCNCIQTTILLGPPAEGRPGPSDDDDDDDDQGTVEGGSRLSVDEGERTPSLLHLVGGLLFVHSNLVFRDDRIHQS